MFITKLFDLFKAKPAPDALPAAYPDAEFIEAVAKRWRERYASSQAAGSAAPRPAASQEQAA
ncbi:MAG: hypothetical protein ACRYFK_20520 [Janthinobacterium lividum]